MTAVPPKVGFEQSQNLIKITLHFQLAPKMRADYCSKFFKKSEGTVLPLPFVPAPLSEADAAPLPSKSQRNI